MRGAVQREGEGNEIANCLSYKVVVKGKSSAVHATCANYCQIQQEEENSKRDQRSILNETPENLAW